MAKIMQAHVLDSSLLRAARLDDQGWRSIMAFAFGLRNTVRGPVLLPTSSRMSSPTSRHCRPRTLLRRHPLSRR